MRVGGCAMATKHFSIRSSSATSETIRTLVLLPELPDHLNGVLKRLVNRSNAGRGTLRAIRAHLRLRLPVGLHRGCWHTRLRAHRHVRLQPVLEVHPWLLSVAHRVHPVHLHAVHHRVRYVPRLALRDRAALLRCRLNVPLERTLLLEHALQRVSVAVDKLDQVGRDAALLHPLDRQMRVRDELVHDLRILHVQTLRDSLTILHRHGTVHRARTRRGILLVLRRQLSSMVEELPKILRVEVQQELLVNVLKVCSESRPSLPGLVPVTREVDEPKFRANDRPQILLIHL